jgi:hypothetical protein
MAKKKHPERQLRESAIALLYYCKKTGQWNAVNYEHGPYSNFLEALFSYPRVEKILDYDPADFAVQQALAMFSEKDKQAFSNDDSKELIESVVGNLEANVQTCWIFAPLRNAVLSKTLELDNVVIITGSKDEKLDFIAHLTDTPRDDVTKKAEHTMKSRDPEFYTSPIIGIKVQHHFEHVRRKSKIYVLWLTSIIHAIYWGLVYPEHKPNQFMNIRSSGSVDVRNSFSVIWGEWDYDHYPLSFDLRCDLYLDWLERKEYKEQLLSIVNEVIEGRSENKLRIRFFKSFRYFIKAIYSEYNKDPFDGVELTILYYIIIAEGLLLSSGGEQRSRLKFLLPRLADIQGTALNEREAVVNKAYKRRCNFVHDGKETYYERDWDTLSKGQIHQDIELLKRMLAKLLCDSPQHIAKIRERAAEGQEADSAWFEDLRGKYDLKNLEAMLIESE